MSVREPQAVRQHIDALQHQINELKESAEQASRESSQQVTGRAERVRAALSRQTEPASDARQAADQSQNQWQAMKTDLAVKMRDLHDRIDRTRGEVRADVADDDAAAAEDAAVDALDYAAWTVRQAELTVLDAIDARARADERAAVSRAR
jgi:chromosome segregation ATPase